MWSVLDSPFSRLFCAFYHNDPNYSGKQVRANSENPDQTSSQSDLEEQSDQHLHCFPFCLHLLNT